MRRKALSLEAASTSAKFPLNLVIVPSLDLIQLISAYAQPHQTVIGFALEAAENLLESAQKKLESKHLDVIVANDLETMGSEKIQATIILKDGNIIKPNDGIGKKLSKADFASWLLETIETIR